MGPHLKNDVPVSDGPSPAGWRCTDGLGPGGVVITGFDREELIDLIADSKVEKITGLPNRDNLTKKVRQKGWERCFP